jgi:hypothetical protein
MSDDELTTDLTRELHGRVDAMHGSSLGLGDVQRKARSIRRRRTATAVVGAAAAVALIVPTAALAGHHGGRNNEPAPLTQTPEPTQTTTVDGHQPAPGVLDVSDLPTGAPPAVAYVKDGIVILPDGSVIQADTHHPVTGLVMLQGTRIFQTNDKGEPWIEIVGYDGTQLGQWRSAWGLAVNPAQTVAAWVDPNGQVMTWTVGAVQPEPLGDPIRAGSDLRITTVVGDGCGPGTTGCSVYVNVADAQSASSWQPWEVTESGSQQVLDGSFLSIADQSAAGLTIGYSKLTDSGSCSKLLGGGEFQGFSTCQHTLASFSPDGRLILADPAYHDGIGNGVIAMYDLKGNRLFDRHSTAAAQAFYPGAEWEDATHVLAPIFQDGKWAVVRIASDGSMEYAVPPAAGQDVDNPYILSTGGPVIGD